jgi:hypothetical protein
MCFSSPFWNSGVEVDRKFRSEDLIGHLLSDDTTPRQKDDDSVEFNDVMPQSGTFNYDTSNKYKMSTVTLLSN